MKIWKSLLILFITLLLAGGGFWIYKSYFSSRQVNSLEVISQNAVFVFETYEGADQWNTLVNDPVWEILKTFPAFQRLSAQLITLDSLNGGSGEIAKSLNGQQATISLHSTGIATFELLFTVNLNPSTATNFISEIKERIPSGSRFQPRLYSDTGVMEYYDSDNNRLWSISLLGDLVVISSSSFLVEEAIRFYVNEDQQSYYSLMKTISYNSESEGRILLNGKGLGNLLKGVGGQRESATIGGLEIMPGVAALDLYLEENQMVFRGPVIYDEEVDFTPSIQANLAAIEAVVSNRTLALTQFNLASIYETQNITNRAFTARATFSGDIQRNLLDRGFLDSFTGELYLLDLENAGGADQNLALLARTRDAAPAIQLLKEFQQSESDEGSDFYSGHEILFLSEEEFPAHLFAGKFPGFGQTFITSESDILIFTNSQQAMKLILDDFRSGSTWDKSRAPLAKKDLSPTSGFSRLYLTDQIWESWTKKANPSWSSFLQKYAEAFQSFPWISFKINQIQGRTEGTLSFPYDGRSTPTIETTGAISLQPSKRISVDQRLTYGPKSIINYQDNTEDLLVQDQNNVLHLINSAGQEVYSEQLSGPIVSDVFQIDYYKNGKLQLLVATQDKIYGIDRLGDPLPTYPISISGEKISHLNLIDYSNNKDYRYFISTEEGDLYLLDKTGEKLEGWDPNRLGSKTIGSPAHYRVPGMGDYMVALTENGNLQLFNRRGENQSGSAIKLGESFKSGLIAWRDPKSRSTQLVGITKNGEVIHTNFNGEIGYRNQLIKNDRDSEFLLVPDQKHNDFVFISRQYNEVSVLDRNEKPLFTTRVSAENLVYQFFDFGSERQLFAITDLTQEFCYLFDLKGNLQTTMPLESTGPIQITYQSSLGQYLIRTISGSTLTEFQLAD
ncbi:hypothetical protein LV84_03887 [Algoriphagus ratkowskyi]|uniref:DUF3352 domain-containing protein n=1 Tax=Algoriphagus ratkowskyi TaxID=57028 RepID=A0A2W7RIY6_9BACT|nr:hypothetical protein [Algoriphagus ratkowskyi]PZX50695.1 hypothetical protein LV84_03887 [Algoriphagus ratkowskyi]TXD75813.1 hypothetical protein ESW18_19230 [Algoriphagus ratkowskyi]